MCYIQANTVYCLFLTDLYIQFNARKFTLLYKNSTILLNMIFQMYIIIKIIQHFKYSIPEKSSSDINVIKTIKFHRITALNLLPYLWNMLSVVSTDIWAWEIDQQRDKDALCNFRQIWRLKFLSFDIINIILLFFP